MSTKAVAYYRLAAADADEIELQKKAIREFAQLHEIEIIHEETDNGVSGLLFDRPGFTRLIKDWITNDERDFEFILMRDVSRLGRFDSETFDYFETLFLKHGRKMLFLNLYELPSKPTT
jgi:DNA invertase Pin-like site-specific DNA recombinase